MITAIIIISTAVYIYGWLASARWMYGHWRAASIDRTRRTVPSLYPDTESAIERWDSGDRIPAVAGAMLASFVWPLLLAVAPLALAVTRIVTSTPHLSDSEMRDKLAARDRHIAELEREAGIR